MPTSTQKEHFENAFPTRLHGYKPEHEKNRNFCNPTSLFSLLTKKEHSAGLLDLFLFL
jgi:hypothetical protein